MKHLATRLLVLTMITLLPVLSVAQTNVYSCDFEDATENSEWLLLGGTYTNQWYIGSAINNGGANALYVSNDGGTSNAYTVATSTTQLVLAIRDLTLVVGEYVVSYDWRCSGQGNNDYMRVALVPESIAASLDATTSIDGLRYNTLPTGWVVADGGNRLSGSSSWTTKQATASVLADGNYSLVFVWYNNKTGGTQPPAAVDNITIVRNDCMSPAGLSVTDINVHDATLSWSGMVGANYELRYNTVNNVATATPYPNTDSTFTSAILTDLTGSTTYYAWVRATCNDEWVAFPPFTTRMACAPITGAHVERVELNNALITWNFGTGGAFEPTEVVVTYGSTGSSQRTLTTTSDYIILTGLTSATTYTVSIRTVCDIDTAQAVTVSFSTPGCDNQIGTQSSTSTYIPSNTYYNYSYTQSLYTNSSLNGIDSIFGIYWYVESEACTANRKVNVYMGNTSLTSLSTNNYVAYSNLTKVYSGQLPTLNSSGTWIYIPLNTPFVHNAGSNMVIALQDTTGSWESLNNRLTFAVASGSSVYWYQDSGGQISPSNPSATNSSSTSYSPIIQLEIHCNTSGCPEPMIIVDEITSDGIAVRWGDPQDGTHWRVEYKAETANNWTVYDTLASVPYAFIGNLESNTLYRVRVGTICAGNEISYGSVQVSTLCDAYAFPYTENFDVAGSLNCWTLNGQTYNTSYGLGCLSSNHSGSRYAVLPEIETVYEGLQFNFDMRSSSTSTYVILGVVTDADDPDNTFTAISDTIHNSATSTFQTFELPVNYYGPDGRLALKIYSNSNYVYIDNIRLMYPPTCFKVSNVSISNITTTSAKVSWTDATNSDPMAYAVQVGDSVYIADNSPFIVTGLDSNTSYNLVVRTICNYGDTSEATPTVRFTTLSHMPTTVPFVETFENASSYAGWEFQNGTYTNKWCIGTATNNGGTHAMYISSDNGTSNMYNNSSSSNVFASREFYLNAGTYLLSYDWKANGESSYDYMRVVLAPSSIDITSLTFSTSGTPTGCIALDGGSKLNLSSTWQTMDLSFDLTSAGVYRLVYYWKNDNSQGTTPPAAIDNIRFRLNSCPEPTNFTVISVDARSVNLSWTPTGNESQWIVSNGFWNDTVDTPYILFDSLQPETTYQFEMWAYCGDGDESTPLTVSATTLCSCPAPIYPTVGGVTANSVSLSWIPTGNELQWIVTNGFRTDTVDNPTIIFDSLQPSTTYDFSIRAYCGDDDMSAPVTVSATTLCLPVETLPYTYGFEDATGTGSTAWINNCFDRLSNTIQRYPQPATVSHWGNYGMYFFGTSLPQHSCLILPEMLTPVDSLELTFYARLADAAGNMTISVGVISDPSDYGTFTEVTSFVPLTTQFEEFIVDFNSYTGAGGRIAISVVGNTSSGGYVYVDDITVDRIPACPKVRNIEISGITTTTANITWDDNGSATAWFIEYSNQPLNENSTSYETRVSTTNNVVLTSLDSNVTYYVRIKANCGINGNSVYAFSEFTTLPYMPTLLPFSDGFENASTYAGWVLRPATSSNPNRWVIGSATSNGGSKALYISSDNGTTNNYNTGSSSVDYASREFYFEEGRYTVSFDWKCYGESTYDYLRAVLVPSSLDITNLSLSTSGVPTGCIALDGNSKLNLSSTWQTQATRIDIATTGIYRLVFYWKNDNSSGNAPSAAIDNVSIIPSNCPAPTGVTVAMESGTDVTLTWNHTANATSWIVSNGSRVLTPTDTTCTFTNLTARTTYLFNVRAVCGVVDTSSVVTVSFVTPCAVITRSDLPLVEDFESYIASSTGDIDPCWTRTQSGNNYYPSVNTIYHYSGSKSLNFPGIHNCYVALPEIDVDLSTLQLSFYTRSLNNDGVNLEVGVMSDPTDISTFVRVSNVVSDTMWRFTTVYFNAYSGPAGRIAIRGDHLGAYVDSLVVDIATGCPVPTNIIAAEIEDTMAVIVWNGNSESYHVQYRPLGSPNWLDLGTFTSSTATITGLMPISTYEVRVSGICSGQQSDWSQMATFTTAEAANGCNPVQGLAIHDVGSTAARVAWNYSDTVAGVRFELRYGPTGFDLVNGSYFDTIVTVRNYIISNLDAGTAYDIYCRALCADGSSSYWAGPAAFSTVGIDAVGFDANVALYPNPANGRVTVSVEGATGQVRIDIINLNGSTVITGGMNASEGCRQFDISNLAKGAYFVRIYGDGVNSVRKLIVK